MGSGFWSGRLVTCALVVVLAASASLVRGDEAGHVVTVRPVPSTPAQVGGPAAAVGLPGFEVLTNESILELHRLGLGETVIVEMIGSTSTRFEMSLARITELKKAGVGDGVIAAMLRAAKAEAVAAKAASADPADPLSPHAPGIYLLDTSGPSPAMKRLEPAAFTQQKASGFLASAFSYGLASTKVKGVIANQHAVTQAATATPTFYFYFDVTTSSLSHSGQGFWGGATSPNEFVLVEAEITDYGRELIVGRANAMGSQSGTLDRLVRPFKFEALADGIYAVRPEPLSDGEYAFYAAGGSTGGATGKVFDFGVTGGVPHAPEAATGRSTSSGETSGSAQRGLGR